MRDKERDRHLTLRRPLGEECIAPRCEHRPHPMTHPSWRLRDDAEPRLGSRGSIRDGLDRVSTDEQRESDPGVGQSTPTKTLWLLEDPTHATRVEIQCIETPLAVSHEKAMARGPVRSKVEAREEAERPSAHGLELDAGPSVQCKASRR